MDEIAVLVPCYNKAQTIKKVVEDFKRVLPQAVIYVYNNNSTDDTAKIAAEAGAIVAMSISRARAMSSAVCSARLTPSAIL